MLTNQIAFMLIESRDMLNAGYVAGPNNINSLPGQEWYPSGMGILQPISGHEIRLIDRHISIWTTKYYQRPDNCFMFSISGIVIEFDSIEDMTSYLKINGNASEGGVNYGYID